MVDISGIDTTNFEPRGDFEALPAGTYEAHIEESSLQPISKNADKGDCIVLVWTIRGGPCDGRKVWQRLNLWFNGPEKNPGKVQEIARQQMSEVANACGKPGARSTEDLHHIPCLIRVSVRTDPSGQYAPSNEIKGVKPAGQSQVSAPSRSPASPPPRAAAPQQAAAGGGWPRR